MKQEIANTVFLQDKFWYRDREGSPACVPELAQKSFRLPPPRPNGPSCGCSMVSRYVGRTVPIGTCDAWFDVHLIGLCLERQTNDVLKRWRCVEIPCAARQRDEDGAGREIFRYGDSQT